MFITNSFIYDYELLKKYENEIFEYNFIPVKENELNYFVLITTNTNIEIINELFNKPLQTKSISEDDFTYFIEDFLEKLEIYKYKNLRMDKKLHDDTIMDKFFDKLFSYAITKRASDIHIESKEDSFIIRFRIDGIMQQFFKFEKEFFEVVDLVLKLKSNLEIINQKIALNGRISIRLFERDIDFRISFMPIIYGESIVIRILDNSKSTYNLEQLNILEKELNILKSKLNLTIGLVIITGPTGSGKSTTLYAIMNELASNSKKLISIEDPIEYKIKNVQQIAVDNERGFSFHEILKNILRQDPDILMIGEIRDEESLSIALQAALTGHLVFATLHTNDSISSIDRLLDLKAQNFILASTLKAIVAQRLVLKLCEDCKIKNGEFYEPKGCIKCNFTGFRGRTIIAEVLDVDDEIQRDISKNKTTNEIKQLAINKGFRTFEKLKQDILEKGLTTKEEIFKVLGF